ncbi:MAG: ArnT family glycosyltransferase, partial [Ardenticatenaceae bacterium]
RHSGAGYPRDRRYQRDAGHPPGVPLPFMWTTVSLLLLLALAIFGRFYRLPTVPPEMSSDHVEKLLDVNTILSGEYPIFFERNTGREPMQFYVIAAIIYLFDTGLTFISLKLSNAVMGVLTVVGVYLLGREVGGHRLGWLAGFFSAVAMWAVAPSRIGLRYPFAPAFTALALWSLLRALRTSRRNDWLIAGVLLGMGLHGYTAFRMMPVVAVLIVLLKVLLDRPYSRARALDVGRNFALYVLVSLLVFLPLGHYMVELPDMFWSRSLTRSTSLERSITESPLRLLGYTIARTLGQFNWVGDEVFVVALRRVPVLDVVSGGLLILGVAYTLFVLLRRRPFLALVLLTGVFLLLMPSALNIAFPSESPSTVRSGGAIPIIALLVALALNYLYEQVRELLPGERGRIGSALLLSGLLLTMGLSNYNRYFGRYLDEYRQINMNSVEVASRMKDYLSIVGDPDHMAYKGWPYWLDARALGIQLGALDWSRYHASMTLDPLLANAPDDGQPLLFVLHPEDTLSLEQLEAFYPVGAAITYRSTTPGHDFVFFLVPARRNLEYQPHTPGPWTPDVYYFNAPP